ncbi:MAG: C40 family peptidase [Bacteroidales bacterium]|nr:C40 family peptidase [Bacteroidales bacterium]
MRSFLRYITLLSLIFAPLASKAQMSDLSEVFIDAEVLVEDTDQTPAASVASTIIAEAMKYLGTPYRWGGKNPGGFDCAGFVRYVYSRFGLTLSPSAPSQSKEGVRLKREDLAPGDLVFYGGSRNTKAIGHVGLVTEVGEDSFKFIHASNTGVRVSCSTEPYYKARYICACRVIDKLLTVGAVN